MKKLEDYLKYEQPTKYIVANDEYSDEYDVPVLTAGKSFVLGYTNEKDNIFPKDQLPVIIFDDFTTDCKYVDFPFKVKSSAMKILHPINNANAKFLYYYMTQIKFDNTLHKRYWISEYSQLLIKELSDAEQNNFVKKMSRIEVLINIRSEQIKNCNKLIKSQFVEMFKNKNYSLVKLKNISKIISGGTPSRSNSQYWNDGTINWVKTTELKNTYIDVVEEKITENGLKNSSAKIVPKDTILLAMYGQGKTRGMTGYLNVEASTNQACACIICSDIVNKKYIWNYLIMSYDKLRNMAKGGNQPNLNLNMIQNFEILLPPIELQNKFAKIVEQIDKQKFEFENSLKKLEELQASLMQEYFG